MERCCRGIVRGAVAGSWPAALLHRAQALKLGGPLPRIPSILHPTTEAKVDEFYRGYRIAIKQTDRWVARVTHARGTLISLDASATVAEGSERCLDRARALVDRYVAFLEQNGIDGTPS